MKQWVNLHCHTTFSMLDGHGSIEAYAQRVKALQMGALAITDHGNVHGWLDFYDECKVHDVKPILGLEAYQARKTRFDRDEEERAGRISEEMDLDQRGPYHLTVLAKDATGYRNLIKLASKANLEGFYVKPRVDHDLISQHSEGLIILSGCLNGEVQQALLRGDGEAALKAAVTMQEIVGKSNYFIEIMDHGIDEQLLVNPPLIEIAKIINAPIVPTGDCHYVNREDHFYHDVMLCAGTKATIDQEDRFRFAGPEFYVKSYDEMEKTFEPEWLASTCDIADMVDVNLEFNELHFPSFPDVPKEETVDEHLERLVWEGAKERYGDPLPNEVYDRIKYELGVVKRMGFQEYFLVVGDLVRWSKDNGIRVGWGRGSAAGSILSYCLRITNLDPLRFGLLFERFLVEGRKSMPDIDLDFDDRYRDQVIEYARQKYGEDRVAHIITFSGVKAKSAVRDAARVLGYEYQVGDKIAKMMPPAVLGVTKSLEESLRVSEELAAAYQDDDDTRRVIDAARGLEGIYRQTGIHAAGVVIAPGPITDYLPVVKGGKTKDLLVTAWDMNRCEEVGLLKIDFLGLRNLGVIDMTLDIIEKDTGEVIDIEEIPLDDEGVYNDLRSGESIGIFQLESSGMREMMLQLQPDNLNDIMALVSLYRPGPLESGMAKMYINRKHGREKVTVPHPMLAPVLGSTYGIMLYQEDVLNVTKALAGFDAGEADDLRKVMGKKLMDKVGEYREKFVAGARSTHDVPSEVSNKVYSDIEYFAGYGFNRAHAASYAMVSYVTAWLKHHYPTAYMAALLTSVVTKKDKLALYLNECRRLGIEVLPPSIQSSLSDFTVVGESQILFGLSAIDGIGGAKVDAILGQRGDETYDSMFDFMRKCEHDVLNKATIQHLYRAGAFDELSPSVVEVDRQSKLELLETEKAELGIYVTEHPLTDVWPHLDKDVDTSILDLEESRDGQDVKLGGIITGVKRLTTKNNKQMLKFTFQDLTSDVNVIVFPRETAQLDENHLEAGSMGILEGKVKHDGDEDNFRVTIIYSRFSKLNPDDIFGEPPIFLDSNTQLTTKQITRIHDIINSTDGDSPVYLRYPEGSHRVTFKFDKSTSQEVADKLDQLIKISEKQMEF